MGRSSESARSVLPSHLKMRPVLKPRPVPAPSHPRIGRPLTKQANIRGAVAAFASRAAEKLRRQDSVAHVLTVFIS